MKSFKQWAAVAALAVLAGCGGGGNDDGGTTTPTTQQYPGGFWEGTAGTGNAARTVFGYIDPGQTGTGGDYFFARGAAGASNYDALFGMLTANGQNILSNSFTYYSAQDGKFVANLTLRGTVTGAGGTDKTNAAIAANYSDPVGSAAATGAVVPLRLSYSALNAFPATQARIAGTYRSGDVFGSNWSVVVDASGALTGTLGGCTLTGALTARTSPTGSYGVTINLGGTEAACANTGTTQNGIAALTYTSAGVKSGIWILTRNVNGTENLLTLNGAADAAVIDSTVPPVASYTLVEGAWAVGPAAGLRGVVLPSGAYFFYRPVGSQFEVYYGNLAVASDNTVTSSDGVHVVGQNPPATTFDSQLTVSGSVSATLLDITVSYPTPAVTTPPTVVPAPERFQLTRDTAYPRASLVTATVPKLAGNYTVAGGGFGGSSGTIAISTAGALTGTVSGCTVTGTVQTFSGNNGGKNLYQLSGLSYAGSACALAAAVGVQSGVITTSFDAAGAISGLRILATAGAPPYNTVLIANKQ